MRERPRITSNQASTPPTFLLVHGTFAPNAQWTRPGSALHKRLEKEFPRAVIQAIPWTGQNRFSARLDAAANIRATALSLIASGSPVFLIGHSHGGSAIIYALNQSPSLADAVAGALFMGTPFMAIATRPGHRLLQRAILVLGMFLLFLGGSWTAGYYTQTGSWIDELWRDWLGIVLAAFVLIACLWSVIRLLQSNVFDKLWTSLQAQAESLDTTQAPDTPMLFLRTTGDEVAMVMAFLQFLCFLSNTVSSFSAWIVNIGVSLTRKAWRPVWGRVLIAYVVTASVVGVCMSGIISRTFGLFLSNMWDMLNPLSSGWGWAEKYASWGGALEIAYRAALFCTDIVLVCVALTSLVLTVGLLFAFIFSTVTFWVFGRFAPFSAIALEMAAEPTPRGERSFVHLSWDYRLNSRASSVFGLRHSEPYSDPKALDVVCGWVRGDSMAIEGTRR